MINQLTIEAIIRTAFLLVWVQTVEESSECGSGTRGSSA